MTSSFTDYTKSSPEFRNYAWLKLTQQMMDDDWPIMLPRGYNVVYVEPELYDSPADFGRHLN